MKKIAVLLSGCGVYDGSEIYETVLTLMALEKTGAEYQCVAPDIKQYHVINHVTGEPVDEQRNVLVEAARLARGNIKSLADANPYDFDGLVVPGGFGAAKNLSNFAFKGQDMEVQPDVLKFCGIFAKTNKPAGYICIAPTLVNKIYGAGVAVTIGNDADTAREIESMGGEHQDCNVSQVCVDAEHHVVTTPAYMLANSILEAQSGIEKCVQQVVDWA